MSGRTVVLGSWGLTAGVITVQWVVSNQAGFPPPGRFLASAVVFSLLYMVAGPAPGLGGALAAGTAFAVLIQPYLKGKPGVLDQSAQWLGALAGQPKSG